MVTMCALQGRASDREAIEQHLATIDRQLQSSSYLVSLMTAAHLVWYHHNIIAAANNVPPWEIMLIPSTMSLLVTGV